MLPGRRRGGGGGKWSAVKDQDDDHENEGDEFTPPSAVLVEEGSGTINAIHDQSNINNINNSSLPPPDGFNIRVLDVRGQTYKLVVQPKTKIGELKTQLAELSGVEVERQRIIHMGKVLNDTDTMQELKVKEGTALHLFQRPKDIPRPVSTVPVPVEGHALNGGAHSSHIPMTGTASVREIPHLVINSNDFASIIDGGGSWELESARRGMRFLGSFLVLVSTMQALEALAIVTAAPAEKSESGDYKVPIEVYLILLRSLLGCGVGALGVRGSHNMERHTLKLYYWGLVVTALFAVAIRVEILCDVIIGKLPEVVPINEAASSMSSSTSSAGSPGTSLFEPATSGSSSQATAVVEAKQRSDYILSAFLGTVIPAMVWFYCVVKARSYAHIIEEHGSPPRSTVAIGSAVNDASGSSNSINGAGRQNSTYPSNGGGDGGGGGSHLQPVVTGRIISRSVSVDRGGVVVV